MRTVSLLLLSFLITQAVRGQIGGLATYQFLNLSPSARVTALGEHTINIRDRDVTLGLLNPALLSDTIHQMASVNHNLHVSDIGYGYIAYGHHLPQLGVSASAGIQYVNYGSFIRADDFGNRQGEFDAGEVAVVFGASRQMDSRLSLGANIKLISSSLQEASSLGAALDIGMYYQMDSTGANVSVVLRNMGGQLTASGIQKDPLPFDLMIGFSKRLKYLPFRWMMTIHDLQQWDLRFDSGLNQNASFIGQEDREETSFSQGVDNLLRHFAFGGELLIGPREGFALRFGYDHQRNRELRVAGFRSLSGFSFGVGIKVKRFQFDYGIGGYHLGGGANHLSLRIDLARSRPY
ncbi:MAG: type IX secretion system protein PorQ [Bacteroidota bacterium]